MAQVRNILLNFTENKSKFAQLKIKSKKSNGHLCFQICGAGCQQHQRWTAHNNENGAKQLFENFDNEMANQPMVIYQVSEKEISSGINQVIQWIHIFVCRCATSWLTLRKESRQASRLRISTRYTPISLKGRPF